MDYIQWSPFFSVSVPELDEDHRRLFDIVNEFFQHHQDGQADDQVFRVLNRLVDYAEQHFGREERLMEQARYPAYHQHRLEHERLLQEIFRINALWEEGATADASEVMAFLQEWLQNQLNGASLGHIAASVNSSVINTMVAAEIGLATTVAEVQHMGGGDIMEENECTHLLGNFAMTLASCRLRRTMYMSFGWPVQFYNFFLNPARAQDLF